MCVDHYAWVWAHRGAWFDDACLRKRDECSAFVEGQEEVEQRSERPCKWDVRSHGGELDVLDTVQRTLERLCE